MRVSKLHVYCQYGCTVLCSEKLSRTYTLKKRAEQQAETRQRIVDAAVDLHSSVGPAATTFSMVAERAGVQRHTLYAHFPDERSLATACSGYVYERDPLPEAAAWRGIADRTERLTAGLFAIYAWYARHPSLMACVMRDVEYHAPTQEAVATRVAPVVAGWHEVLGAKLNPRQRAMLHLAISFFTWRILIRDGGLTQRAAVAAMVQAIDSASKKI
jgi:AcrR family transcriptional regulator